ncbi:MAG: TolC family protein [Bacteroidales bacterium]
MTVKSIPKIIISSILVFLIQFSCAQNEILDEYIQLGLKQNISIQIRENEYLNAIAELQEAKRGYFPGIKFFARYTVANGGRVFEVPAGDLLNPVYAYLHQISPVVSPGMPFPNLKVPNQSFPIFRSREQDTYFELQQPIYNRLINLNKRIKKQMLKVSDLTLINEKLKLVYDIRCAYYDFLSAKEYYSILDQTEKVLIENVRVNKGLYKYGKNTKEDILRSQTELKHLYTLIADADKKLNLSQSYFNLLLDRSVNMPVKESILNGDSLALLSQQEYLNQASVNRPELKQLDYAIEASSLAIKLKRSSAYPTIGLQGMAGIQGEEYDVTNNSVYLLGSLVLQWKLFDGTRKNKQVQQSKFQMIDLRLKKRALINQITLEVSEAYFDFILARKNLYYTQKEVELSSQAFQLIEKKYSQGQSSLLEFIDARNTMSNAQKQNIISKFNLFKSYAFLLKVCGINEY